MSIQTIRRARLREVIEKQGGATSVAKRLGQAGPSYIGQLLSGKRPITEKTARMFEQKLLLKTGTLDQEPGASAPPFTNVDHQLLSRSVLAVAEAMESTGLRLTPLKQADLVSVVYEHSVSTGSISPDFVQRMLRLLAGPQ